MIFINKQIPHQYRNKYFNNTNSFDLKNFRSKHYQTEDVFQNMTDLFIDNGGYLLLTIDF